MKLRFAMLGLVMAAAVSGCNKSADSSPVPARAATQAPQPSASNAASGPSASANFAPGSDADLVRQAVEEHVRGDRGINLSAMDMSVDSVDIAGDKAQANATFRVKQGGASMEMSYSLERHGSGWLVMKDEPANGQFVHPPMDQTHSPTPGAAPNGSGPGMPDVHEFLKNHPATTNN